MSNRIPKSGYIGSFKLRGIPIYIHWSFPIGGLFLAKFLGDFTLYSIVCLVLAYTILILVHELGHAFAAELYSCKVQVVLVTWVGGWCVVDEELQFYISSLLFYAGGIIAQLILLFATISITIIFGSPTSSVLNYFILVFTIVNVVLIIVNLIPFQGADGEKIWNLLINRN